MQYVCLSTAQIIAMPIQFHVCNAVQDSTGYHLVYAILETASVLTAQNGHVNNVNQELLIDFH